MPIGTPSSVQLLMVVDKVARQDDNARRHPVRFVSFVRPPNCRRGRGTPNLFLRNSRNTTAAEALATGEEQWRTL